MVNQRKILILILLSILIVGVFIGIQSRPVEASEGVFIRSQTIYCDRVDVSFEVIVAFPTDTATVNIWQGGSVIASTSGPSTSDGIYNVSVPLNPPVPIGTVLSTEVVIDDGGGFTVTDTGASMPCYENAGGDGNGGDNPPPPPSDWDGYTDGRLNPDMAEYYTVYCREDYAHVYRSSPPPTVKISEISIRDMLDLNANGGHFTTDGITVERNGDQITLSGNNGNLAPESGLKTFSLEDCVAHNGSEPDEEPPSNPPPSDPPPTNPPDDEVPPGNIWDIIFEWILEFLSLWCNVNLVGLGAMVFGLPLIFRQRRLF